MFYQSVHDRSSNTSASRGFKNIILIISVEHETYHSGAVTHLCVILSFLCILVKIVNSSFYLFVINYVSCLLRHQYAA